MITLPDRVVALLKSGFDCAGDGGIDPFSNEQREEVDDALRKYDTELANQYAIIGHEAVMESRRMNQIHREQRRDDLLRQLRDL